MADRIVAYLIDGHRVLCQGCARHESDDERLPPGGIYHGLTAIYSSNLGNYRQSCHECGDTVKFGATGAWPELWAKRNPTTPVEPVEGELQL